MKKSYRGFPFYTLVFLVFLLGAQYFLFNGAEKRGEDIEASKLYAYVEAGGVKRVALQGDTAFVLMNESTVQEAYFSDSVYDYRAQVDGDSFAESCRQIAANKNGVPLDTVTALDLGFDLVYLAMPETPWLT